MKIAPLFVLAAVIAPLCRADDNLAIAERFLDASGTATVVQQNFINSIRPQLDRMKAQGAPQELVSSIFAESQKFFDENFKWDAVKPQVAKVFADQFTADELKEIVAFYETPTGQKYAAQMPGLTQKAIALAMAPIQSKIPELSQRVNALVQAFRAKSAPPAGVAPAAAPGAPAQNPPPPPQ